jgi:ribonuclease P protein component
VTSEQNGEAPGPTLWRITDRRTFAALRRDGRRARAGTLGLTWLAPPPDAAATPPKVALAVSRAAGGAVARNRIRRRVRAALRELRVDGALPTGTYLVTAGPEARTEAWTSLVTTLRDLVATVTSERRASA